MSKRKVLIAVHQLNLGGVQKALISVLNAIDYSKNEVTLYIRKDRTDLLNQVNKNVSKIIINKDKTKYYRKPYAIWLQLLQKIHYSENRQQKLNQYMIQLQMRYEKMHYFSDDFEYDVAISYIQSLTAQFVAENIKAKRKVMFYHGSTDEYHEVNERIMSQYEMVYCVSKGAQEAVKSFYPQFADKIDCIENYVDAESVRTKAKLFVPDYPKDKLILCSCGRITPVKGFDLAVGAADILKQSGLDFKWYFVGDGVDRPKIESLISEKQLDDYIEITGLQDNLYPYIKNCDIYVQPSYEEAHPLSIIEAQILLKPIVSTATVGGKSIIVDGETGVIAEIKSDSLAQKINSINQDKDLQDDIQNNISKIDYSKDYQRFRKEWEKLLLEDGDNK